MGFGLWNSVITTLSLESIFFFAGLALYLRTTKSKNKIGNWGMWTFIAFMIFIYLMNAFGSIPPSVTAIAWAALFQWVLVIWAYWFDRNRVAVEQ